MMLYILYRIGLFMSLLLPLRASYAFAACLADLFYLISKKDRDAVIDNLKVVLGPSVDEKTVSVIAKDVFRNFAKYLVDFFRFQKIDGDFLKKNVRIIGAHNLEKARAMGKGVIALSAHLGNWELGGAVVSLIGYPISGVVLTHQNKHINNFFTRQRLKGNMQPIEMGASLKGCYRVLRANELLALLGDRDFTGTGLSVDFFGKKALIPKGPAVFSYRLGSPIVPTFLLRQPDDSFVFIMEEPIMPSGGPDEETAIAEVTRKCTDAIEACIRNYPAQWYAFRPLWKDSAQ